MFIWLWPLERLGKDSMDLSTLPDVPISIECLLVDIKTYTKSFMMLMKVQQNVAKTGLHQKSRMLPKKR